MPASQAQGLKLGARGGANLTTTTADKAESGFGYVLGATGEFGIVPFLFWQPEILLSQQSYEQNLEDANINQEVTLGYIQIPVQAKVKLFETVFFNAGPQVGFLLNDEVTLSGAGADALDEDDIDYASVDFSIAAGVGYILTSGTLGELQAEVRGNFSLSEAADVADNGTIQQEDFQNRNYMISLAYLFGL